MNSSGSHRIGWVLVWVALAVPACGGEPPTALEPVPSAPPVVFLPADAAATGQVVAEDVRHRILTGDSEGIVFLRLALNGVQDALLRRDAAMLLRSVDGFARAVGRSAPGQALDPADRAAVRLAIEYLEDLARMDPDAVSQSHGGS